MAPYLMNSETAWIVLTTITAAGSLLFAALGGAAVRPPRQHAPNDADDHATGRTSFLHRPLLADPATLLWVFTSFSLVLLVMGLLLFATRATGTMTSALGSVVGAKNCLVMVFWMAAPSFAASKGSFVHRFSLLSLASGMFFSTYLGAAARQALRHFLRHPHLACDGPHLACGPSGHPVHGPSPAANPCNRKRPALPTRTRRIDAIHAERPIALLRRRAHRHTGASGADAGAVWLDRARTRDRPDDTRRPDHGGHCRRTVHYGAHGEVP